jgi:putative transposase
MIDRTSELSITRQCALLQLPRSTAYYKPVEVSEADHTLMRCIDKLHLQYPFAGSRMLRDLMKKDWPTIGRRHVRTLMRKMGLFF